ncbi:MAG: hypothetical protein IIY12_00135 [Clostridia bacterium]|nr:hypothetical protein [Clostridia bacterium]
MKHNQNRSAATFLRKKRTDLIFAGVALFFLILMIVLLVRYSGLRKQNASRPEEYGTVMEQLNEVKTEKSELESKVDALNREINELNKKISSLSGN